METKTLRNTIEQLEGLFETFNSNLFENQLSKPIITVSPDTTKGAYGWCTSWKAWKENGHSDDGYYEINICAEYLARPYDEVAETMLHEMVHLYDFENGVKDTSRGWTYHNKRYKEAAEAHGLIVENDEKYGWCKTSLTEGSKAIVEQYMKKIGKTSFDLYRASASNGKKASKSNSIKYVCPCCGIIVRATKKVNIKCYDCDEVMEPES